MTLLYRLLLSSKLPLIYSSSVNALLLGHVLYSAGLTSTIFFFLQYISIYSSNRYLSVFPMLYQLYYLLSFLYSLLPLSLD